MGFTLFWAFGSETVGFGPKKVKTGLENPVFRSKQKNKI
jgi:hypothetical protein